MEELFDDVKANALFLRGRYKVAFERYYRGAVSLRDSLAAFNLAFMFHQGYYTPVNYEMARRFYHAAASLDGGASWFNLAIMNLRGQGAFPDFKAAMHCMKQSAAMGCVDAQLYLGMAYTLGQAFDPIEIECISLIPFYRIIKRSPEAAMLTGDGFDPHLEEKRFEVIETDEYSAVEMFEQAAAQTDDTYMENQIASAKLVLGQALIEGFGKDYDPDRGFRLIEEAAVLHQSKEAAGYLRVHMDQAKIYGVDIKRAVYLLEEE